ncbi:ubiquitin-conjugating enzyme/RWD-like protein [Haematococcus lacustris]
MSNIAATHNASTMRKLVKELSDLHDQPPEGIRVIVNDANVWDVAFEVEGPSATPFEGGVFKGRLVLGPDFPVAPPKGFFITKIFHPNVSQSGEICVNVLKKDWTADTGLRHVLVVIKCLLVDPNPESALNEEAGRLLLEDYEEYAGKARLMTSIHARRGHGPLATSNGHANLIPVTAANDSCATQKSSVITDISMSPASKKSRGDMLPKPAAQVAASKVKKSLKRL